MATKILFHSHGNGKHCPDGFGAAYVAWRYFNGQCEFIPCVYQQAPPKIEAGDNIYLLDFSYPREVLLSWKEIAASITVLDHHKTAQADLEGLPFAKFDMNRSGVQIAWNEFFPYHPEHKAMFDYIADRDLWKKELPYTEEISRALSIFPQDFEVWDTLANLPNYVDFMRRIGEPLQQKHLADVEEVIQSAQWKEFSGYRVLATNTTKYSVVSDALNELCKRNSDTLFAVNWSIQGDKIKYELRSIGDFDVSEVAREMGGGGHKNAAGCASTFTATQ